MPDVISFLKSWKFFVHSFKQVHPKRAVIHVFHQQQFFGVLIRPFTGRVRHQGKGRFNRLHQQPVIIDAADDFLSVIEDLLPHHSPILDRIKAGQLLQDKGQILLAGCHDRKPFVFLLCLQNDGIIPHFTSAVNGGLLHHGEHRRQVFPVFDGLVQLRQHFLPVPGKFAADAEFDNIVEPIIFQAVRLPFLFLLYRYHVQLSKNFSPEFYVF